MTKLTVVTTTYNHENYIKRTIESFLEQKTNFNFDILISDDCSTDGTREILKEYEKKYPSKIKVIYRKKNIGAMNNFVETLNSVYSEYVALCDGDDYWTDPKKLQKQVDFLDKNPDYNICFHKVKITFEDHSKEDVLYPLNVEDTTTFKDLIKENYIPANSIVYRWLFSKKDSFKKEFPENVVPGDYFVHLYHAYKGKIKFIDEVMSIYMRNSHGMWWLTSQEGKEDEFLIKYGEKYFNFFDNIEKKFNLEKSLFAYQKKYLCYNTARVYLKRNNIKEFYEIYEKNKELLKNENFYFSYDDFYKNLNKIQKTIFLLFYDRKTMFNKIRTKLKIKKI